MRNRIPFLYDGATVVSAAGWSASELMMTGPEADVGLATNFALLNSRRLPSRVWTATLRLCFLWGRAGSVAGPHAYRRRGSGLAGGARRSQPGPRLLPYVAAPADRSDRGLTKCQYTDLTQQETFSRHSKLVFFRFWRLRVLY